MVDSIGQGPHNLGVQNTSNVSPKYESFNRMSEAGNVDQAAKKGISVEAKGGGFLQGLKSLMNSIGSSKAVQGVKSDYEKTKAVVSHGTERHEMLQGATAGVIKGGELGKKAGVPVSIIGGVIGGLVGGALGGLLKTARGVKLAAVAVGFTLAQVFVIPGRAIARAVSDADSPVKENKVNIPPGSTEGRV